MKQRVINLISSKSKSFLDMLKISNNEAWKTAAAMQNFYRFNWTSVRFNWLIWTDQGEKIKQL